MEMLVFTCFVLYLFFAIATASSLRFALTRQNYIWASTLLAIIFVIMGYATNSTHMLVLGVVTFFSKALLIPMFMTMLLEKEHGTPKLFSRLRPTLMRMISVCVAIAITIAIVIVSPDQQVGAHTFQIVTAFSAVGIALLSLIASKSTYGQLFGVLMIENAFSLLIFSLGIELHLYIELGLLLTALTAWLLMHTLSLHIRNVFGDVTIDSLNELSE